MKKVLLLFLILFGITFNSWSQTNKTSMAIGVQGGWHNSWISFSGTPLIPTSYLSGGQAGVQFQYMSRPMLGFETSLLYTNIGWQERGTFGLYTRKIKAVEWQLNTHLSLGKKWLRLLADAGPYLRFFIAETANGPADLPQYSMSFDNNFQYGLFAGGGLGIRTDKIIIQLRGHFNVGLTNFFDSDVDVFFISADRVAGASASVMIPFGKATIR